jgi:hypothetical protein
LRIAGNRCRALRAVVGALAGALLGGCAHSYADADGNRHFVGIMHLTLPPAAESKAADWMRWRTVGVAISRSEIGNAVEIGYSDNTLAVVRNNSCAALDRLPLTLMSSAGEHHAASTFVP